MQTTDVTVHYITPAGMAFGHTPDRTQVFIPKRLVAALPGFDYGTYRADVIPNPFKPEKTPLMAVELHTGLEEAIELVEPLEQAEAPSEDAAPVDLANIANEAVQVVLSGGAWTAPELADRLCHDVSLRIKAANYIGSYLKSQFLRGAIARAVIQRSPDQKRPSLVRYAADWREL